MNTLARRELSSDELVRLVNDRVAEQAVKFVYGVDDSQLRFVANRLGKMIGTVPELTFRIEYSAVPPEAEAT